MPALLIQHQVDLLQELQNYRQAHPATSSGALASFIGSMRDMNLGSQVSSMTLEHYPEMVEKFFDQLCTDAIKKWQLHDILLIHRYGEIQPGEDIVLVACWSAHRAEAFDACREVMEALKARAPFWKQETTAEGQRWVHDDE